MAVKRSACEMLGYTREELLGLRDTDIARYPEAAAEFEELMDTGPGARGLGP